MQRFELISVKSIQEASAAQAGAATAQQGAPIRYIAGGTNLVDFMKLNVERPEKLIDINRLPLDRIEPLPNGGFRLGALTRNSDVANHSAVKAAYPVLSQAILSGASTQLRNMATTAGNLLQKTRCVYYRGAEFPCNKRQPGSGCGAIGGHNRMMAILGTSDHCIASNPSDQNVALMALDAKIHISGVKGERVVPITEFYLLPRETPHLENTLEPGDLVTHVSLPPLPSGNRSLYLKLRDRASYEFALASAAIVVKLQGDHIAFVRVAIGGVGTIPWRSHEAERVLQGKSPSPTLLRSAAEAALHGAKASSQNGFKIELAERCLIHALSQATTQA